MTAHIYSAPTRTKAWVAAARSILTSGETLNVVLSIENPAMDGALGAKSVGVLDALYASTNEKPIHTVAETIFPAWLYMRGGARGVFEGYPRQYRELRKLDSHTWGTYAGRMLLPPDETPDAPSPLEALVTKMRRFNKAGGQKWKAAYELAVLGDAQELALHDNSRDAKRLRGAPCLSHLSFKLFEGRVHLTALYRSHDYLYKVPGNLLGLARLQAFVASEAGAGIGGLVVHSTLAFVGGKNGRRDLARVLSALEASMHEEE